MSSGRLYDDIHSAEIVAQHSTDLVAQGGGMPTVAAVERGHREYPSGVTEDYERIEFS